MKTLFSLLIFFVFFLLLLNMSIATFQEEYPLICVEQEKLLLKANEVLLCKDSGYCFFCEQQNIGFKTKPFIWLEESKYESSDFNHRSSKPQYSYCDEDVLIIPSCIGEDIKYNCEFGCFDELGPPATCFTISMIDDEEFSNSNRDRYEPQINTTLNFNYTDYCINQPRIEYEEGYDEQLFNIPEFESSIGTTNKYYVNSITITNFFPEKFIDGCSVEIFDEPNSSNYIIDISKSKYKFKNNSFYLSFYFENSGNYLFKAQLNCENYQEKVNFGFEILSQRDFLILKSQINEENLIKEQVEQTREQIEILKGDLDIQRRTLVWAIILGSLVFLFGEGILPTLFRKKSKQSECGARMPKKRNKLKK